MSTLTASPYDKKQVQLAAIRKAMRCQEEEMEEQGMVSSSGDFFSRMWSIVESQTSSALDWVGKCSPSSGPHVFQRYYEPLSVSETTIPIEQYLESEAEVPIGPPEKAWKPLRVELVMVEQSPFDL
ncbi:MAG: hypothetical protein V1792_18865 [Pseudomonadota bacterium]